MLPVPIDLTFTALQQFFTILLAATAVNFKIVYKKIFIIAGISAISAIFNVCLFQPYVNIFLKIIFTMIITVVLVRIFTKLPILYSVVIILFSYIFCIIFESVYLTFHVSYINHISADLLSDVFMNSLAVSFQCIACMVFTLILKQIHFQFLNFNSLTQAYLGKFKPIFLLIILIQIMPISFYFMNIGFMLYGTEILQTLYMDQILSLFRVLNFFFIALSMIMLYLINLIDKNMIKNAISILHGEYIALHQDEVQVKYYEKEQIQQQILVIKKHMLRRQYSEALFELNQIDSYLHRKGLLNIQYPSLRNFLQNKIYLAQLAKIDFILEVDEDLSGLEYYIEDSLLEMLQELYNNAFEAALEAEFSEVYSKFIREENEFIILINNNGIVLPPTHQYQLFNPNYTRKKALIHGQGLFKVKKLLDYYDGSIDIRGYDGYTRVTVKLPIRINNNLLQKESDFKYKGLRLVKNKEEQV